MIKRLSSLLLVLLALAPFSLARVISYAPYTDQAALRAYHDRTSRYFILLEGPAAEMSTNFVYSGRAVLYDATGVEEPRVIYPTSGSPAPLLFAALYQESPNAQPLIIIGTHQPSSGSQPYQTQVTMFSADGGRTWQRIPELDGKQVHVDTDLDLGGPWTRGLAVPVRIGSGALPFVVSYHGGVWGIRSNGTAQQLFAVEGSATNVANALVAQNREGTKFVVRTPKELTLIDVNGASVSLGEADAFANYSGWITPGNEIYLVRHRAEGRFAYLHRNGQWQFLAGPADMSEPGSGYPTNWRNELTFFAIPTYDFAGAWMILRDQGKPTSLHRHMPGEEIQAMWSDVSGPEVEALHAGSSKERLLIQVHRDRPAEVPFIDPALAVWKIGEPAPRGYDELYLNEGSMKGFVHLDVETIASGAPFVFDSGFIRELPLENVSPPISGGGGDVIQEWGVVRASLKQRLVLPGVARLRGAFNSYWLTDVVIYNPLDEKQVVDVQYVALGDEIQLAAANVVRLTLEPRELRVLPDVLHALYDMETGGGALYFSPEQAINVTGRTYSRDGEGTFGFGMMAIDFFNAAGPRFPLSFSGAFPGPNFRTNIILTDTSGRGTEARLQGYGVSGTMGASDVSFEAPINGVTQVNGVSGLLGLYSHEAGGMVVQATRGSAIPAVVAIDNRTNDPTYFPPDLPASTIRTIPVIGHVDGAHGSRFRSDIYLLNLANTARSVTLEVKRWDRDDFPKQMRFTLLPNEARVIPDALMRLFNMEGLARLRYWSDGGQGDSSGVRVTSRTYNIREDGGTFGSLIPPLNNFQSASAGEQLEIIGIVGGSGFRTNIGLVDLAPSPNGRIANVRLLLIDDKGKLLDSFSVSIPSAGGMQINNIFAARGLTTPAAARVVIQVLDAFNLVGAYATLTDNTTNDSTFLGAQLAANPN